MENGHRNIVDLPTKNEVTFMVSRWKFMVTGWYKKYLKQHHEILAKPLWYYFFIS